MSHVLGDCVTPGVGCDSHFWTSYFPYFVINTEKRNLTVTVDEG